jgi:hypothetical protein
MNNCNICTSHMLKVNALTNKQLSCTHMWVTDGTEGKTGNILNEMQWKYKNISIVVSIAK